MCGIVGYIGPQGSTEILLTGLSKLEYRGYDSAGIAVLTAEGLQTKRAEGKLRNLMHVAYLIMDHKIHRQNGLALSLINMCSLATILTRQKRFQNTVYRPQIVVLSYWLTHQYVG